MKITILKYGYFGEDEAHRVFLHNYLDQLLIYSGNSDKVLFEFDEVFTYKYRGRNKTEVDNIFPQAVQEGFVDYQHDFFVVGRDLDTFTSNEFKDKITTMKSQLQHDFIHKTMLMIPVQCIEHWLWYLKINLENPLSTKNEDLESKPNKEAKLAVYGNIKASNKVSIPIVESLTNTFDIAYLESRSESFRNFHNQVKSFIDKL